MQRLSTVGCVVDPCSIARKCLVTASSITAAIFVGIERIRTVSRVEVAACVVEERLKTAGRVVGACIGRGTIGIASERKSTVGRVVVASLV